MAAYKDFEALAYQRKKSVVAFPAVAGDDMTRVICSTFAFGRMVVQVVFAPIPDRGLLDAISVRGEVFYRLWPPSQSTVRWPPKLSLDASGFDRFHERGTPFQIQ
ncbi:MAG: hypothetical protein LC808_09490 [Actinobacteria bacterium]|nr:hypothetical protein [Actinomycetota bacterium]